MKILILTTGRSDYYLLLPLIRKIASSKKFNLKLVATGSHLSRDHGNTFREIIKDKIHISKKIKLKHSDELISINSSVSKIVNKFGKILNSEKPKGIIILGDRYEALGCGITSLIFNIPVIHINGGELTYGAMDDTIRHVLTKISTYHFVSHSNYRKRVIQMGEKPQNVYTVGHLGIENVKRNIFITKTQLEKILKIKFLKKNLLVTYHPETQSPDYGIKNFINLLSVLKKKEDTFIIFTKPNFDQGSKKIDKLIKNYLKENKDCKYISNLGSSLYFSLAKICDAVVGNSSSGVIEIPSLNKPTLNIGIRQYGRLMSKTVINCENPSKKNLQLAINKILYNKNRLKVKKKNLFKNYNTSEKIFQLLKKINFNQSFKRFHDLK